MSEPVKKAPGIADYKISPRKRTSTFLDELDSLIDWKPLERLLNKSLNHQPDALCNPAYPAMLLLKVFFSSAGTI